MGRLSRVRSPRGVVVGRPRSVAWSLGPRGTVSASSSSVVGFPTTAVSNFDNQTIVRLRGSLLLQLKAIDGVGTGMQWAFGICIVTENAAGVGVTAVPAPLDDIAWDGWFVHRQGSLFSAAATIQFDSLGVSERLELDSKAMRKVHQTDTIIAMIQFVETNVATVDAFLESRVLTKIAS